MLRAMRRCQPSGAVVRRSALASIVLATASLAGCSADISRFGPSLSLNDPPRQSSPMPAEPMRRGVGAPVETEPGYDRQPAPAPLVPPPREPAVRMSGLPDPEPRPEAPPVQAPIIKRTPPPVATPRAPTPVAGRQVPTIAAAPGETIEVKPGDTLYGIAKRHRVAISEIMTLNNLTTPALKPGQKLVLPAGKRAVLPRPAGPAAPETVQAAPAPAPTPRVATPAGPTPPPSDWTGTYTVAPGDSLYAIAKRHKVKAADLQSANGITDPLKVRPGVVLKVPGPAGAKPPVAAAPGQPDTPIAPPVIGGPRPVTGEKPLQRVAEVNPGTQTDTPPTAADPPPPKATVGATRFRWPVKGKVIARFGPRPDNTHNDGINISVPAGTEVLAAENGVVAYAGNELKGYGNLVLVRHENGWVSAYAHNDTLLVKRGDKVKRGQPVAKAGTSGSVDQPQVHFELRQGSKPVDPLPHMEPN